MRIGSKDRARVALILALKFLHSLTMEVSAPNNFTESEKDSSFF